MRPDCKNFVEDNRRPKSQECVVGEIRTSDLLRVLVFTIDPSFKHLVLVLIQEPCKIII